MHIPPFNPPPLAGAAPGEDTHVNQNCLIRSRSRGIRMVLIKQRVFLENGDDLSLKYAHCRK